MKPVARLALLFIVPAAVFAVPAATAPKSVPPPPATVEHAVKEADLATVKLAPQAEQRLGIKTVEAARRAVTVTRLFGGELLVPPGRALTVSTPLAGTVQMAGELMPGQGVRRGQTLFRLHLLLAPTDKVRLAESQAEAAGQVDAARVQVDAARLTLRRAEDLARSEAGSRRAVDDARAALAAAEAALKTAQTRVALLGDAVRAAGTDGLITLPVEAPLEGLVARIHAASGAVLPAGAPLAEITSIRPLWLRVPVYVGELDSLDLKSPAQVGELKSTPGAGVRTARPITAPPSANAAAATADLFYELDNADGAWRPGQRVGVTLAKRAAEDCLVVPWAAVLQDIHGGQWVYEHVAPQRFVRRRVLVDRVVGADAVLVHGPKPGARIVTDGATELFGTEFGIGK